MVFSSERLPLMLKPPLVSAAKPGVVEVAADDARLQRRDANRVAAGERQLLDVLGLDGLAHRHVGLERRRLGGDRDVLGERAGLEREVERLGARGVERDVLAERFLEPLQLGGDVVFSAVEDSGTCRSRWNQ